MGTNFCSSLSEAPDTVQLLQPKVAALDLLLVQISSLLRRFPGPGWMLEHVSGLCYTTHLQTACSHCSAQGLGTGAFHNQHLQLQGVLQPVKLLTSALHRLPIQNAF